MALSDAEVYFTEQLSAIQRADCRLPGQILPFEVQLNPIPSVQHSIILRSESTLISLYLKERLNYQEGEEEATEPIQC